MLYANLTCPHCRCILKKAKQPMRYECRACHADVKLSDLVVLVNKNKKTIPLVNPEGKKATAKIVIDFKFMNEKNEYLCYTFGNPERDLIYITLVDRSDPKNPTLLPASDIAKARVEIILNDITFKDKLEIVHHST